MGHGHARVSLRCMPRPPHREQGQRYSTRLLLKDLGGGGGLLGALARASFEQGGGGGEGVLDPKLDVPIMASPDFPYCKFRFFPLWSLWSGEGGGVLGEGSPPIGF